MSVPVDAFEEQEEHNTSPVKPSRLRHYPRISFFEPEARPPFLRELFRQSKQAEESEVITRAQSIEDTPPISPVLPSITVNIDELDLGIIQQIDSPTDSEISEVPMRPNTPIPR